MVAARNPARAINVIRGEVTGSATLYAPSITGSKSMKRYLPGLFAIGEIFAVLIAGSILGGLTARLAFNALGIDPTAIDEISILAQPTLEGAIIIGVGIATRFFWLLLFAYLILRFVHHRTPGSVGVSRGGHSVGRLVAAGLLLFAVGTLPWKLILLANEYMSFGDGIDGWQYMGDQQLTWAFVAVTLASAVLLPPLFEEPFARGYMRARLAGPFGGVGGVILAGILFMSVHGHFYVADGLVIASLIALTFAAICWTWSVYRTGSIIPAFIAHALTNAPAPIEPAVLWSTVLLMIGLVLAGRHVVYRELRTFATELGQASGTLLAFGLGVIAVAVSALLLVDGLTAVLGLIMVVLMIIGWLPRFRNGAPLTR